MSREQLLEQMKKEALEIMREKGYGNVSYPVVKWNIRLRTVAGKYRPRTQEVELSWHYYTIFDYKAMFETLLHEIAHHIHWILYKERSHNRTFKVICAKLGGTMNEGLATGEFADCATKQYVASETLPIKFIYGCPCGNEWKRKRRSDFTYRICSKCKGNITLKKEL